jgi:threonine aldolase
VIVDLRSDTVTRPTPQMRQAIAEAAVGDDVYGEDTTVTELETRVASMLGKEAGLFVPSGTMGNQLAIRVHVSPGDEVIIEKQGHSFLYESGALAGISGAQAHPVDGERGILTAAQVKSAIRPRAYHYARTRLVVLENTSNAGGGTIYSVERTNEIADVCREHSLPLHLDGARLWNAHVASGVSLSALCARADSVSVCLSKGLGAPVGSVLVGARAFITEAHRLRKMFGGGMRQVGLLAAAGLYALDHHLERLAEDHANLKRLASGLAHIPGLECEPSAFPTNIAYVKTSKISAADLSARLRAKEVWANPTGPNELRVVTHLDVNTDAIDEAIVRFSAAMS